MSVPISRFPLSRHEASHDRDIAALVEFVRDLPACSGRLGTMEIARYDPEPATLDLHHALSVFKRTLTTGSVTPESNFIAGFDAFGRVALGGERYN